MTEEQDGAEVTSGEGASDNPPAKERKKPAKRVVYVLKKVKTDAGKWLYEVIGDQHGSSAAALKWIRENAGKKNAGLLGAELEIASFGKTIRPTEQTKKTVKL